MVYLTAGLKRLNPEGPAFVDASPESVRRVNGITNIVCRGGCWGRESDSCGGRGWISISIAIGHRCGSIIRWHVGDGIQVLSRTTITGKLGSGEGWCLYEWIDSWQRPRMESLIAVFVGCQDYLRLLRVNSISSQRLNGSIREA
jgi:hypothetical protein